VRWPDHSLPISQPRRRVTRQPPHDWDTAGNANAPNPGSHFCLFFKYLVLRL
jgi:hypothetical protein